MQSGDAIKPRPVLQFCSHRQSQLLLPTTVHMCTHEPFDLTVCREVTSSSLTDRLKKNRKKRRGKIEVISASTDDASSKQDGFTDELTHLNTSYLLPLSLTEKASSYRCTHRVCLCCFFSLHQRRRLGSSLCSGKLKRKKVSPLNLDLCKYSNTLPRSLPLSVSEGEKKHAQ